MTSSVFDLDLARRLTPETPSLEAELRLSAVEEFLRRPMPRREDEAWRKMDLSFLNLEALRPGSPPQNPLPPLHPALVERGVTLTPLREALLRWPELCRSLLSLGVEHPMAKWDALGLAFWSAGYFVHVPRGVDVRSWPLVLPGVTCQAGHVSVWRHGVVLEPGAQAVVVEEQTSPPLESLGVAVGGVDILLQEQAQLHHVVVHRWGRGVWAFYHQRSRIKRQGQLTTTVLSVGDASGRLDYGSLLEEEGAQSRLSGAVFADGKQHLVHHTLQEHQAPHTESDVLFKSVAQDQARTLNTGLIRIAPEAQQAVAYQSSKNLLLSSKARAQAIPMLEILTGDVKCGHGAAVGPLDDDQRFYLMSRGLSPRDADRVIVEGFFGEILSRLPPLEDVGRLNALVEAKWSKS